MAPLVSKTVRNFRCVYTKIHFFQMLTTLLKLAHLHVYSTLSHFIFLSLLTRKNGNIFSFGSVLTQFWLSFGLRFRLKLCKKPEIVYHFLMSSLYNSSHRFIC